MELLVEGYVKERYIDLNGHMNVTAYYHVFNKGVGRISELLGFDVERQKNNLSFFTVETHITYVKELHVGTKFKIYGRILEYDDKRIHFFEEMYNENGELAATCETMFLGVSLETRKVAPFSDSVLSKVQEIYEKTKDDPWPKLAGRKIGIPVKK